MGNTWKGNWKNRVYERVAARGFSTVTDFADSRPTASLLELADELGPEDVAAIQLETLLYDEAKESGYVDRFARSLLVRSLRERIPDGWNVGERYDFDSEAAGGFGRWTAILDEMHDEAAWQVWQSLRAANIPRGWLPSGPDDPILLRAFEGVSFNEPCQ
jgi:hypothetical protein